MLWIHDLALDITDQLIFAENGLAIGLFALMSASLAISWLMNRRSRDYSRRDHSLRRLQNM